MLLCKNPQGGGTKKGKHSDKTGDKIQNNLTFVVSRWIFFVSAIKIFFIRRDWKEEKKEEGKVKGEENGRERKSLVWPLVGQYIINCGMSPRTSYLNFP